MIKIKPSKKKNSNKPSIIPVGSESVGFLYFEKRGFLSIGETLEITKYEMSKKQSTAVLNTIIKAIAKDKNITREQASEYIFGKDIEGGKVYPKDQNEVLLDYENDIFELNKLQIPTLEIKNFVANLMISGFEAEGETIPGRVAYQIELQSEVNVNDDLILIEPVSFPLLKNTKIKFGDVVLTVSANHESEVEAINIEKSGGAISANSTGFLYDPVKKEYILGNEEWSYADTAQLPPELIEVIYEFYLIEAGKGGNPIQTPQTPLEETKVLEEAKSTGTNATLESKNIKSETPVLIAG